MIRFAETGTHAIYSQYNEKLWGVWYTNCREIPQNAPCVCQQEQNMPSKHGSEDKICRPPVSTVPHPQINTHRIHEYYDYLASNLMVVIIAAMAFKSDKSMVMKNARRKYAETLKYQLHMTKK
jgi:hypothetical protein